MPTNQVLISRSESVKGAEEQVNATSMQDSGEATTPDRSKSAKQKTKEGCSNRFKSRAETMAALRMV